MNVLDTFYFLFKTDASKVEAEMIALEKHIDSLKDKGKKRSEQENKDLKESVARQKELAAIIKNSQQETKKFTKSITDAAAALASFQAIRNGLISSTNFNSNLAVQSKLLQQNARDMKVYASAAEAAGGSKEGALSDVQRFVHDAQDRGINPEQYKDWLRNAGAAVQRITGPDQENRRRQYIRSLGYANDPGTQSMLLDPKLMAERMAAADKDVTANDADIQNGRKVATDVARIRQIMDSLFTKAGSHLPDWLNAGIQSLPGGVLGTIGTLAVGKGLLRGAKSILGRILGIGGAEAAAAGGVGLALPAAALTAIVGTVAGLGDLAIRGKRSVMARGAHSIATGIDEYLHGDEDAARSRASASGSAGANSMAPIGLRNNNPGNLRHWKSASGSAGGFAVFNSPQEGIAAMADNLRAYGSRHGINTLEGVINRWAPSSENNTEAYIKHLERTTGFKRGQNLDLQDPDTLERIVKGIITHENGKNPFSDAELMQSITAGRAVMAHMGATSPAAGGRNTNVTIGNIEIQTRATDAQGISQSISTHLTSILGNLAGNVDDGVMA